MANKNKEKQIMTRVSDEFFAQMEIYKNKHHINWSSKIRALIESEMAKDEDFTKEKKKSTLNPLLDRCCSVTDLFEFRFNTSQVVQQECFSFDNEFGIGFQIVILLDKETNKFVYDDGDNEEDFDEYFDEDDLEEE